MTSLLRLLLFTSLGCTAAIAQQASPSPSPKHHPHGPAPMLPGTRWHVNDLQRPAPPVVTPGVFCTASDASRPPSDAIVLFGGSDSDLAKWETPKGDPAPWPVTNGEMDSAKSDIQSKQKFGDIQLHVEYAEPTPATGSSQGRGNSGVFLMGLFEIQVLDNYKNPTYPDGMAGAVYAQTPPMVNACRPPGEWQSYDIAFTTPRLDAKGNVSTPAYVTVFHNGVLVQNHTPILGPTGPGRLTDYHTVHTSVGPVLLQFHHNSVRYRSVWVRPLAEPQ